MPTTDVYPMYDDEYENDVIDGVHAYSDGTWAIHLKTGPGSFTVMGKDHKLNPNGIVPQVGDAVRFYGKGFGYAVRGLFVRGQRMFYRTKAEQDVWSNLERMRLDAIERERWENTREERARQVAELPDVFSRRIEGFRERRPDTFWKHEHYETFCCVESMKIVAEAQKQSPVSRTQREWICDFHKAEYDEQRKLVPTLFDDHSGNTFGTACLLANIYVQDPDMIPQAHGALCPFLGCQEYGCYASTPEAEAAREARDPS